MSSDSQEVDALIARMEPVLHEGVFVYCSISEEAVSGLAMRPMCTFQESEGVTIVVRREEAEQYRLDCTYPCRLITLTVHSSLTAVGFLAAITARLAREGISVNAVSAYFHDHLFVPVEQAERALSVLREMQ